MKLRNIFLIWAVCATITSLSAQQDKRQFLSLSFHPLTQALLINETKTALLNDFNTQSYETVFGEYGYKAVGYSKENYLGALSLEYKRYISGRGRLNFLLGCELSSKKWDIYDIPDGPRTQRFFDYRITAMPGMDYVYFQRKRGRIYGSAYAGAEFLHRGLKYLDHDLRYQYHFAWQFMPLCGEINVSESLSIGCAYGYGTLGIFRLNLSYDF